MHTFSVTLAALGDQTLMVTATAEATGLGRAAVPVTSDAAAPARRMVQPTIGQIGEPEGAAWSYNPGE